MDAYLFLIVVHVIGTIVGVGGATMIELHLNQALRDNVVSSDEGAFLKLDYSVVRVGLILSILSGFGFLLYYKFAGATFKIYNPVLWAKLVVVLIIAANTLLLQARKINLYWGASFSFVSWWAAALLGILLTNNFRFSFIDGGVFFGPFLSILISYLTAVVIGASVLHYFRNKFSKIV